MTNKFLHEALTVARFGLVGISATMVYMSLVFALLSNSTLNTLLAHTIAYCVAFGVSFTGHYFWTFQTPGTPKKVMRRFFVISVSAFAVNTLLLSALLNSGRLSPLASAIFSAAVVPGFTFLVSRFWGFRRK